MIATKLGPNFYKLGIRALALFQLYLAYLMVTGSGFGFEALSFSIKATIGLMFGYLNYMLWVTSSITNFNIKIRVALGCILVGLVPLITNLTELIAGNWEMKDSILLGYLLIGLCIVLDMYLRENKNEN